MNSRLNIVSLAPTLSVGTAATLDVLVKITGPN